MANDSPSAAKTLQVFHEPKNNRYIINFENGGTRTASVIFLLPSFLLRKLACAEKALLEYKFIGEKEVDFYHTEVPPSQQGKGIAAILAGVCCICSFSLVCSQQQQQTAPLNALL